MADAQSQSCARRGGTHIRHLPRPTLVPSLGSQVMEFCAGGDLIDRLECRLGEKPLSELKMLCFLESLCHALHHVHCCGAAGDSE